MTYMLLFALVAMATLMPTMIHALAQNNSLMVGAVTARQLHAITQAAKSYITAYAGPLEASATATTPATITVPMLINTGFLPAGFGSTNPYQQTWEVQVLQPSPGSLQSLVLSEGGRPIALRDDPRIGAESGASGGSITGATVAQGSYGSWQVPLNGYTNPGPGHLAALIAFAGGQLQSNYLYRTAVPGQPQLNTMQTDLNLGANNITNAQNITANGTIQTNGRIGAEGEPANSGYPTGWGGGMHTWDLYANGTVGVGVGGGLAAYMANDGHIGGSSEQLAPGDPNGQYGALQIGNNFFYGDGSNAAVRTPGAFYVQNQPGTGPAPIVAGSIYLQNNQVSYYNPCGVYPYFSGSSCTGQWNLGNHAYCALSGDLGWPAGPVMVAPSGGGGLPDWTLYSWDESGKQSSPLVTCFD